MRGVGVEKFSSENISLKPRIIVHLFYSRERSRGFTQKLGCSILLKILNSYGSGPEINSKGLA